jgi:hypothetical protein
MMNKAVALRAAALLKRVIVCAETAKPATHHDG